MLRSWRVVFLLALVGCSHEFPPEPVTGVIDSTPDFGPPMRLTLNTGADYAAAFTPDGGELWYTWEQLGERGNSFCLGRIPIAGGTRRQEFCPTNTRLSPDSTDWFLSPAPHPDGRRVVWYHLWTYRGSALSFPHNGEFMVADLAASGSARGLAPLHLIPFSVEPGPAHYHDLPERLVWANDSTMLYLPVVVSVLFEQNLPQDTIHSGLEIGRMTLGAAGVTLAYLPGTAFASGVDVHPDGTVYFTRNGDATIYRTHLDDPAIDTAFDASAVDSIVRDAVVRDTIAYVILKGQVTHTFLENLGFIQSDGGGELWRLTPGTATLIDGTKLWRRPVLSPDGHDLIVEGRNSTAEKPDLFRIRID